MDPNATVAEIRRIGKKRGPISEYEGERLVELFSALDDWLVHGGFLPEVWAGAPATRT